MKDKNTLHYLLFSNILPLFCDNKLGFVQVENLQDSLIIYKSMFGLNGIELGRSFIFRKFSLFEFNYFFQEELDITLIPILPLFNNCFYLPNLNEILKINNLKLEKIELPSK